MKWTKYRSNTISWFLHKQWGADCSHHWSSRWRGGPPILAGIGRGMCTKPLRIFSTIEGNTGIFARRRRFTENRRCVPPSIPEPWLSLKILDFQWSLVEPKCSSSAFGKFAVACFQIELSRFLYCEQSFLFLQSLLGFTKDTDQRKTVSTILFSFRLEHEMTSIE